MVPVLYMLSYPLARLGASVKGIVIVNKTKVLLQQLGSGAFHKWRLPRYCNNKFFPLFISLESLSG